MGLGIMGATLVLIAHIRRSFDKASWWEWQLCSAIGSLMLLIYAFIIGQPPFIVLNSVWLGGGVIAMVKEFRQRQTKV